VSGVFKFFISLSQIDFVIIMAASDLVMKGFTYSSYIGEKIYNRPESAPTTPTTEEEQLMLEKA
jgi:hypothetical protein